MTLSINDIQHNSTLNHAECRYAECPDYLIVMLNLLSISDEEKKLNNIDAWGCKRRPPQKVQLCHRRA
jgi:hypothetical protein